MSNNLSVEESRLFLQVPRRLHHAVTKNLKKPSGVTLHKTQIMTLMLLKEHEPITMHNLGCLVGMGKGSFTQVIDKLVETGYAQRERVPEDRRSVQVTLTQKGIEITDHIAEHVNLVVQKVVAALEKTELDSLLEALKTIDHIVEKIEDTHIEKE